MDFAPLPLLGGTAEQNAGKTCLTRVAQITSLYEPGSDIITLGNAVGFYWNYGKSTMQLCHFLKWSCYWKDGDLNSSALPSLSQVAAVWLAAQMKKMPCHYYLWSCYQVALGSMNA